MAAESIALCDYITNYLTEIITEYEGSAPVSTIERVYDFVEDLGKLVDRKVYVFPLDYVLTEPISRKEDMFDVRVGVVVAHKYDNPSSPTKAAPVAWVDDKVDFVETYIFSTLAEVRMHEVPLGGPSGEMVQYWPQEAANNMVFDYTKLSQHKVFWSELEFVFRKVRQ